jgi:ParB family chromosome partitioning protein
MSFPLEHIKLEKVDSRDLSFVVSYGFDLARLKASIELLGLLSPPLLRRRQDGRYQIVCGYQRLLVLTILGWPELPALLVPDDTPAVWCLQASLHDNVFGRGFNTMEAASMIARLLQYMDEDTIRKSYLPLLGLPPSRQQLQRVRCVLALERPWQELVAQNRLGTEAAALLSQWAAAARAALLPWFQSLQLSFSKQLELLEHLTMLSRRAGNSPADWLARLELVNLLADPVLTKSEKNTRLWETLRQWCFPRASQTQQQFQNYLKVLRLYQHPEMRLTPAPAFEDSSWRLELRFHDKSQLARQLQQLQKMLDQPELEDLLHL